MTNQREDSTEARWRPPTERERLRDEGRALLRIARELKSYLSDAPVDDPDVQSLLADCGVVERIGQWLSTAHPIVTEGISTR